MASSTEDQVGPLGPAAWYKLLHPLSVDLVGDFAGKELFAIHGDALMLYCITNAKVDLDSGFQLLHAIHAVENFLKKLQDRGLNFHVIWFRDHEALCLPRDATDLLSPKYLLIRAILIRHLNRQQSSPEDVSSDGAKAISFEFEGLDSPSFQDYLTNNAVHCFTCLDAPAFGKCSGSSEEAYLGVAHHFAARGYCLAFINSVEFSSSRVRASVMSPLPNLQRAPVSMPQLPARESESAITPSDADQSAIGTWSPWGDDQPLSLREAISLRALAIMATAHKDDSAKFSVFASAFIIHLALLRQLPLSQRSFVPVQDQHETDTQAFLAEFSRASVTSLDQAAPTLHWDLFDLVDGRLLGYILSQKPQLPGSLTPAVHAFAKKLEELTSVSVGESLPALQSSTGSAQQSVQNGEGAINEHGVLPFSHPALNDYLQDIRLVPTDDSQKEALPKIFRELTHWHNARVSVANRRPPPPKNWREMRADQKQMASTIAYSASLNNASGKRIEPEVIIGGINRDPSSVPKKDAKKDAKKDNDDTKPAKQGPQKGAKKGKAKSGKELAMEARQALQDKKASSKTNDRLGWWEQRCKELSQEKDLIKRYLKAIKFLNSLSLDHASSIGAEVSLYACNVLATVLVQAGDAPPKARQSLTALIWSIVRSVAKSNLSPPTAKMLNVLATSLQIPAEFTSDPSSPATRQLPFSCVFDAKNGVANLAPVNLDFQLRHCGPFLERSFDPAPDPRVPFNPDGWQRNVLDAIDANKSLFVVAPTSAGKTFISFYAMRKVLKESDDGVLVYVAPTKALVNQIAAEIQARFTKSYKHDGRSVWAIHTRDYRVNNPAGCQILVTVPHILQIMLMAPSNAEHENSWSRRIKRIIFDEVHSIGQAEDGVVWEQLLLLAPCPIIALSATVGNPVEFRQWLESTAKSKGLEFETVVHQTRYSDLRKFLWKPSEEYALDFMDPVERLPIPGLDDNGAKSSNFFPIHPVATLVNRNRETLDDLTLEPRDCLLLWKTMEKHQNADYPLSRELSPPKAFPKVATKPDVAIYEAALKKTLHSWMLDRNSPFDAVQKDLQPPCHVSASTRQELEDSALPLLTDLRTQGALPAILFNYDRTACEEIAFRILSDLEKAEEEWKATDAGWKKKVSKWEQWKKDQAKADALRQKTTKAKAKGKRDEDDVPDGRMDEDPSTMAGFNPDAPLERFSLGDETKLTHSDLEWMLWSLRWKNLNPDILNALRRGIGIHHAGMNRKYRQIVEMLFRKGFLTVVIATGTLALGLNMPCKTVVFFGDSVFLTALNYHQAAGRAGRRGFDLLGNVVFVGMPQERVYEIMSSRLPDLRGHFPLSTSLVLRTLSLLHHTNNADFSVNAVQSLLSQTRLYLGGPSGQLSIKHHLRFSIEYLRRQHLLSEDGAPLNFAGLVGHLYFTENSVFAFHSLLKEGYFHKLCEKFRTSSEATLLEIVLVLSHIFGRISTNTFKKDWKAAVTRSDSIVFLPPLPEDALQTLRQHNQETLDIFRTYASTYVRQHLEDKPDMHLPSTKTEVGASKSVLGEADLQGILGDGHNPPTKLRSPFHALSGFGDSSFGSIHELCDTVRSDVFLEESAIPYIPLFPDDTNSVPWNAYLYDFFKHGDMEALVRDNHIKKGDVWFLLKDFSLVLATVVTSLTNFLDLDAAADSDLAMMDVQDAEDAARETSDALEPDDVAGDMAHGALPVQDEASKKAEVAAPVPKKKKKKVIDSWDDDGSSEDEAAAAEAAEAAAKAAGPAWEGDGEKNLAQVLRMFKMVQQQFDEKFRKQWA
ncbi:DEAD/DEAH box helicase [Diaporthe helianthi]|uniref:DEAD/DEAH box helicase n=1 Tax=Diaporthe helianthi TaxID=158607 RepID=A0A2P5HNR5_DIAHE|nr:DEAD/DEAH box helicase [Diaporthe helianthi]